MTSFVPIEKPDGEMKTVAMMDFGNSHDNPTFEGEKELDTRCDGDGAERKTVGVDDAYRDLETEDETEEEGNRVMGCIAKPLELAGNFLSENREIVRKFVILLLILGYIAYMIAALIIDFNRAVPLLVIFCIVVFFRIYGLIRDRCGGHIWELWKPAYKAICKNMYWIKWVFLVCILGGLATWIALDTSKRPNQLISMAGYIVFLILLFIGSKYPGKVRWRPVFWGLGIQICLGMFILRTQAGFNIFDWMGNIAQTFLDFVNAGSSFVFGEQYFKHYFAFKVLPIIVYFSSFISILYYLGAMQWLIYKIAWLMQFSLGTSATESMCAAGNIFVGMTESPLLIRPYLKDITTSEMHAVMTAGFGTIAGSVLGAYLGFGIDPVYVITACVMAAPCSLAISKLVYPETEHSKFMTTAGLKLEPMDQRNIIEAAFVGASASIPIVLSIGANLIAFLSLLAAINAGLSWYGGMLDYPQLSFELICSYVFLPITFMMGIEWQDCFKCAELLGSKIFLNEFIAYEELARMIKNKSNGTISRVDENGAINWISDRSEAVITYALCGFANLGSVGITLGGLGSMCPERQGEMAKIVLRALVAGVFVSLLNASLAGFLYVPPTPNCTHVFSYEFWNATELDKVYECCVPNMSVDLPTNTSCRCCEFPWEQEGFQNVTCLAELLCS